MVIVDSSVWIEALWGTTTPNTVWLNSALGRVPIGLTSLVLCEVLQGVRNHAQFRGLKRDLLEFPVFAAEGSELAIESAQNYLRLRDRGITVRKTIDCFIATFCIKSQYRLLHNDRDFDAFEAHLGLQVVHPPSLPES